MLVHGNPMKMVENPWKSYENGCYFMENHGF
jgi:hypothetical protein